MYTRYAHNVICLMLAFLLAFGFLIGVPVNADTPAVLADTDVILNETFVVSQVGGVSGEYQPGKYFGYKFPDTFTPSSYDLYDVPINGIYLSYFSEYLGRELLDNGGVDNNVEYDVHIVDWAGNEFVFHHYPTGQTDPVHGGTFRDYEAWWSDCWDSYTVIDYDNYDGDGYSGKFGGYSLTGSSATGTIKAMVSDYGSNNFDWSDAPSVESSGSLLSNSYIPQKFDLVSGAAVPALGDSVSPSALVNDFIFYDTYTTYAGGIDNYYEAIAAEPAWRYITFSPVGFVYASDSVTDWTQYFTYYLDNYDWVSSPITSTEVEFTGEFSGKNPQYHTFGLLTFKEFWIEAGGSDDASFSFLVDIYNEDNTEKRGFYVGDRLVSDIVEYIPGHNDWGFQGFVYNYSQYDIGAEPSPGVITSQNLYVIADNETEKFYLWLNRSGYGSSLIIEGSASAGLPLVTITNGGRDYTQNYYVALDMYDSLGQPYTYDVQISAFNQDNTVVKFNYSFTAPNKEPETPPVNPDDPDDPDNPDDPERPPTIEIPDFPGGIISSPSELPSIDLPFDFEAPLLHVDFTSSFDNAFNNTWLGVSDVYYSVSVFIDNMVRTYVPVFDSGFMSVVLSIEGYTYDFMNKCDTIKNEYAFPFYNFVVRFGSLIPTVVWLVFDVWLFYCCAKLLINIFTCPLSDVIRRYF